MPRLIGRAPLTADHVRSGRPSDVDLLSAIADWVARRKAPAGLALVVGDSKAPFAVRRSRAVRMVAMAAMAAYKGGAAYRAGYRMHLLTKGAC